MNGEATPAVIGGTPVVIQSAELSVTVLPAYGARVVSLFDRRNGREWMAQGGTTADVGETAGYGEAQAVGWDECFPTVSSWDARSTPWKRVLRDHGDLWGRPWTIDEQGPSHLATRFATADYRFFRRLTLSGARLEVDYRVDNLGSEPLPAMWAWHALLAPRDGEPIDLPPMTGTNVTYVKANGHVLPGGPQPWPSGAVVPFDLSQVQPITSRVALKLHALGLDGRRARLGSPEAGLDVAWEGVGHVGLWLAYGGWPTTSDIHQVAIEPTTSLADHLGQAVANGTALEIPGGASHSWRLVLTVTAGDS